MVNEVKFDHVDNVNNMVPNKKNEAKKCSNAPSQPVESGVHIRLRTFQDLMIAETSNEDCTRVLEMKQRIDSNQYKVDTDELAKRMFHHLYQNKSMIG